MSKQDHIYCFIETDDSCAICGIRGRDILTVHHIDRNPNNKVYENEIVLCYHCHHVRHHEINSLTTKEIKDRKRHLIQKTITQYGVNAMKIAYRNQEGVVAFPFLMFHLLDLDYMAQQEGIEFYGEHLNVTNRYVLTERGQQVHELWLR